MIVPSNPFINFDRLCFNRRDIDLNYLNKFMHFSSGRVALISGMIQLGLRPGDCFIIPAYYCESALSVIESYGLKPIFLDVNSCLEIDNKHLELTIKQYKVRAMVLVHFFGITPKSREESIEICHKFGVKVIEDQCHSINSTFLKDQYEISSDAVVHSVRKIFAVSGGGLLWMQIAEPSSRFLGNFKTFLSDFSFFIKKTITFIATEKFQFNIYSHQIDKMRNFSPLSPDFKLSRQKIFNNERHSPLSFSFKSIFQDQGYLISSFNIRRKNFYDLASQIMALDIKLIFPVRIDEDVPQILPVIDETGTLLKFLRENGIGAYSWPGHELPKEVKLLKNNFPNANKYNESIVCLPIHQDIDPIRINRILFVFAEWLNNKSNVKYETYDSKS